MDVGHDSSQADDHNTNQNEATLVCRPSQGEEELSHCPVIVEKLGDTDSQTQGNDNANTGTCITDANTCDVQTASDNNSNDVCVTSESQKDHDNSYVDCKGGSKQTISQFNQSSDDAVDVAVDACPKTPRGDRKDDSSHPTDAASPNNDSTAVDISMTSDDNIQVTCRCSSTPVNFSVHNALIDTDCSMSSVGDASPISNTETKSKCDTNPQACNATNSKHDTKDAAEDRNQTDNSMMLFPHKMHPNKPAEPRYPQTEHTYSPRPNPYYTDRSQTPGLQQNYPSNSMRPLSASPYEYPPFNETTPYGYNYYQPYGQRSMADMATSRNDMQQMPVSTQPDRCCYPTPPGGMSDRDYFVYPSIYVSNAGLISVLLRNDMSVEMTVDRTIRVVSHNHMMAVATDSKGTAASLYHPAVKIFQMGYNTDIATDMFRAKMSQGEAIFFSNGINCFKLQDSELQPMTPIKFSDIQRDQSVNLLFSSEGYGESLVATCMQVAAQAEYANLPKGGVIVRINGVKVTQSGCGDVTVVTGAKFIRLSPYNGTTRLGNRFVDIEVERDWSVKLIRGTHSFTNTKKRTMVSNGKMEAGFDEHNGLKVINLQSRHPLLTEPNIIRRPGKRMVRTPPSGTYSCFTPRRRVLASGGGRGGVNTC